MAITTRLTRAHNNVLRCALVTTQEVTDENMQELQTLLNSCYPESVEESEQYNFTRALYAANPVAFCKYITSPHNGVRALVLWTDSKTINSYLSLNHLLYIRWDRFTQKYEVLRKAARDAERAAEQHSEHSEHSEHTDERVAHTDAPPRRGRRANRSRRR